MVNRNLQAFPLTDLEIDLRTRSRSGPPLDMAGETLSDFLVSLVKRRRRKLLKTGPYAVR